MRNGCLLVIVGGVFGALDGLVGSGAAMRMVGGGHSHDDLFVPFGAAFGGLLLGALLGPKVIGTGLRALERRRVDRLNGEASPSLLPAFAYFVGSVVAAFAAFASFYYSMCIARLPPELGGPVSTVDPAWRAGASLLLAVALTIASGVSLFRWVRSAK